MLVPILFLPPERRESRLKADASADPAQQRHCTSNMVSIVYTAYANMKSEFADPLSSTEKSIDSEEGEKYKYWRMMPEKNHIDSYQHQKHSKAYIPP